LVTSAGFLDAFFVVVRAPFFFFLLRHGRISQQALPNGRAGTTHPDEADGIVKRAAQHDCKETANMTRLRTMAAKIPAPDRLCKRSPIALDLSDQ
jgi:hypothetical protein